MPRVPLPLKVLLSYALVLAIGVLPTYFYLDVGLERGAIEAEVVDLAEEVHALADVLGKLPSSRRVDFLRERRALLHDRVTLVASNGDVLFDTQPNLPLSDHNDRAEIRMARGVNAPGALAIDEAIVRNTGVARRTSATTNDDRLYVAAAIQGTVGTDAPVIRVSRSVAELMALKHEMTGLMRNTVAVAISVAILLSLLSAFVIVRPLMRVRDAAGALAAGDWTVEVERPSDDEIGDIAKSIQRLGGELRKRMAAHGVAEGLVEQLVEVVPAAAAIFSHDGSVIAVNGPGRVALHIEGPTAGRRIRQLLEDPRVATALKDAEDEGVPQEISISLDEGRKVVGAIAALKRPGDRPYFSFVAVAKPAAAPAPMPSEVAPRALSDLVHDATQSATKAFAETQVHLDASKMPDVIVADAGKRLEDAVGQALAACSHSLAGKSDRLCLHINVEGTRVGVALAAGLASAELKKIRPLMEPLGGSITSAHNEVTLWLPRA